ncbi:hypothetical protein LI031_09765 [Enterocloster citroniae]|uniref:hypothetical protein n=1 Tax=Enterocloster citroniae TaxID=358743 RepID=UPI001D08291D|nr:hypothetical protein [Enterocloster citroniae]MCB7064126.1 hypothetical protein [Enterocloster citroniae]
MSKLKLNLRMFEGEGADGGDAGEGAAQEMILSQDLGTEQETNTEQEPQENEPENREESYKKIREDYQDLIAKDIDKAINRRNTENRQLQKQLKAYEPLIGLLNIRYGVKSGKVEDVMAAIERDDSFYEAAATQAGLSVEQYRAMMGLQMQNQQLLAQQREQNEARQREQLYNRWNAEAERCQQMFPNFNMELECQNPDFARMLESGVSMEAAYRAVHFEEISQGLMVKTESETKEKLANTIRSGATRPSENGAGKSAATKTKIDVASMTDEQMDALIERAQNGEHITFS